MPLINGSFSVTYLQVMKLNPFYSLMYQSVDKIYIGRSNKKKTIFFYHYNQST